MHDLIMMLYGRRNRFELNKVEATDNMSIVTVMCGYSNVQPYM